MDIALAPAGARQMVIAAHPDDLESWCAGTLAQAIQAGADVRVLLVTSGDAGAPDATMMRAAVATLREAEAHAAAQELGIREVTCLRYPDGEVENTHALRRDLVCWIRRWQPDIVYTHDPEHPLPPYLTHRDHRIVGRAALDAVYPLARDRLAFADDPEMCLLPPQRVSQVWLFASTTATACVDISVGFDRKIAARLKHTSQTSDPNDLAAAWRVRAAAFGAPCQIPLAETFTVLTLD